MIWRMKLKRQPQGFTLIEVILTITVASIFSAMMFAYFGTSLRESANPVIHLQRALFLTETAERITAHYMEIKSDPTWTANKFKKYILDNSNTLKYGHNYSIPKQDIHLVDDNNEIVDEDDDILIIKIASPYQTSSETITLLFTP